MYPEPEDAPVDPAPAAEDPEPDEAPGLPYSDPFHALIGEDEDYRVADIGSYLLDWMGTNKSTWESAKEVWDMLSLWYGFDLPVFKRVKNIAVAWLKGRARKIEMCRNGCVAFINCKHPSMQAAKYQNAGAKVNIKFTARYSKFTARY